MWHREPRSDAVVGACANQRLRIIQCVRGSMAFNVEVSPRLDYGRQQRRATLIENGAVFTADGVTSAR